MTTVELTNMAPVLQDLLTQASEKNLLLRTPDGRMFLLAALDDFDEEIERTRQNQALMDLLDEHSQETERYTIEDIRAELDLA
jgi:hypothetical protein